ncbi:thiamine phosphate synthase [Parasphingopyxis algicola]|uniref:thiamine phosphate synthase n=1 Tax=Parasphingopyxis algicola TaxID=2026624 RepID=UPI0015A3C228|nr:thiamine phosphate synthase [Parasphingopyxis algicola]QLC24391.1 thiamine phosphate synthase [Parasphingopyxis algicola]
MTDATDQLCQLYLVSPPDPGDDFPDRLARALGAGPVAAFQLRMKQADDEAVLAMAERLMPICAERGCAFILNDRADLAARLGADGVHIGRSDGDIAEARALLGRDAQIGATCHDSRHFAMEAGEAGADYVAFGAFYPSDTKETTHRSNPEILTWWSTMFVLPCVAIGGITAENAQPLVDAGADFLAVSGAVWKHPDGEAAGVSAFAEILGV